MECVKEAFLVFGVVSHFEDGLVEPFQVFEVIQAWYDYLYMRGRAEDASRKYGWFSSGQFHFYSLVDGGFVRLAEAGSNMFLNVLLDGFYV